MHLRRFVLTLVLVLIATTAFAQQTGSISGRVTATDGSALADVPYKTEDWLLSEVFADLGETVVLDPQRLRDRVAQRARRLQRELQRVPSAS